MSASRAIEQSRDVDSVAHLWRKLGRSPGGIAVYSGYLKRLLREARGCDYRDLCADRVVQLALGYARRRQLNPQRTRWMWLSSFRAFAWGLQRLGKEVGSVDLNRKPRVDPEPVVRAYIQYGKQVGWSDQTMHSHLRHLGRNLPQLAAVLVCDRSQRARPRFLRRSAAKDYVSETGPCATVGNGAPTTSRDRSVNTHRATR